MSVARPRRLATRREYVVAMTRDLAVRANALTLA
jgi:hypothetical protein